MTIFRVRRLFGLGTGISIDHEASGYNRSESRIQAIRICNPNRPADGLMAGGKFRWNGCRLRNLQRWNLQRWLQIPIIPIYHLSPIQPNWPSRVRLPLQLRHRPGPRRSGRRVRFRAGNGRFRFVRGAGRRPTRRGARMRYVSGIRTQSCGAGGDTTEHGRAARLRTGSAWTRNPARRAVRSLVPTRRSRERRSRDVSVRLTQTSRPAVTQASEHPLPPASPGRVRRIRIHCSRRASDSRFSGTRCRSRQRSMRDYSGTDTRATDIHCLSATSPQTLAWRSFAQGRTPGTVRLGRASTRGRRRRTG